MARIIWADPALKDVDEIAEYIALEDLQAAKKLVKRIFDSIERLRDFPESGRAPPELGESRYRELVVGPGRVFYRAEGDKVLILHVTRSERMLRNFLLSDREGRE